MREACGPTWQADLLEKDDDHYNTFMITGKDIIVNKFVSVPPGMGDLNCASFVAGIVAAVFDGAHFVSHVLRYHHLNLAGIQIVGHAGPQRDVRCCTEATECRS